MISSWYGTTRAASNLCRLKTPKYRERGQIATAILQRDSPSFGPVTRAHCLVTLHAHLCLRRNQHLLRSNERFPTHARPFEWCVHPTRVDPELDLHLTGAPTTLFHQQRLTIGAQQQRQHLERVSLTTKNPRIQLTPDAKAVAKMRTDNVVCFKSIHC